MRFNCEASSEYARETPGPQQPPQQLGGATVSPTGQQQPGSQPTGQQQPGITGPQPTTGQQQPNSTGSQPTGQQQPGSTGLQPTGQQQPGSTGPQPAGQQQPGSPGSQPPAQQQPGSAGPQPPAQQQPGAAAPPPQSGSGNVYTTTAGNLPVNSMTTPPSRVDPIQNGGAGRGKGRRNDGLLAQQIKKDKKVRP